MSAAATDCEFMVDETMLMQMMKSLLGKLHPTCLALLISLLMVPGGLSVGTACSGLETPHFTVLAVTAALAEMGHAINGFCIDFSCEFDPNKARFIMAFARPALIFKDIRDLGKAAANTWKDTIDSIPCVRLFIAGFSCKDMSYMSVKRKADGTADYIQKGMGTTGATFAGVILYLVAHMPTAGIFENVKGIRGKPLRDAVAKIREAGYMVVHRLISAEAVYLPQSRPRMWFFAIRLTLLSAKKVSEETVRSRLNSVLDLLLMGNPLVPLERLLLRESHPSIIQDTMTPTSSKRSAGTITCPNKANWVVKHLESEKTGFDITCLHKKWCIFEDLKNTFPGLCAMTLREADVLQRRMMAENFFLGKYPALVMDCNLSLQYQASCTTVSRGVSPCVLPSGKLFHTARCRYLKPTECLRLQGLWLKDADLARFEPSVLYSGAGNAFAAPVCGLAIIAILVVLGEIEK